MDFIIECPRCKQQMQVKEEWIGNEITCPSCREEMTIPSLPPINEQPVQELPAQKPHLSSSLPRSSRNNVASLLRKSFSGKSAFLTSLGKISCLLTVLLALTALAIGIYFSAKVRSIVKRTEDFQTEIKNLQEQQQQEYDKLQAKLRQKLDADERTALWDEYNKTADNISDQIDKREIEYKKWHQSLSAADKKLFNSVGSDWETPLKMACFYFISVLILCGINMMLFPVCANAVSQTETVISSIKIVRIMQLSFLFLAVIAILPAIDHSALFYIISLWMACIAAALFSNDIFAVKTNSEASSVQDLSAWIILPLKASLYMLPAVFSAGVLFSIYELCQTEYSVAPFFTTVLTISLLPPASYFLYLFGIYFWEIGLAIVSIPQLLNKQNKNQ